jgi:hypothetical protein
MAHLLRVAKEKGPREAGRSISIELCDVAFALIHERVELLKLLRENAVCKKGDHALDAALERLKHLERVSHQVQLAVRNSMGVKGRAGGVEPVWE